MIFESEFIHKIFIFSLILILYLMEMFHPKVFCSKLLKNIFNSKVFSIEYFTEKYTSNHFLIE